MADSTSRKVIEYVADVRKVLTGLKKLEKQEKKVGTAFGKTATKGLKQVGDTLGKISKTRVSKVTKDLDRFANTTTKVSKVLRDARGNLTRFTKTTRIGADGVARTSKSFQTLDI